MSNFKRIWHDVATFEQLQEWLEERDLSISDISRCRAERIEGSGWMATIEPNNPSTPLMAALGASEEDFRCREHLCAVTEEGEDLAAALRAVMRKVDELLDER
jgi:hypothetical protein